MKKLSILFMNILLFIVMVISFKQQSNKVSSNGQNISIPNFMLSCNADESVETWAEIRKDYNSIDYSPYTYWKGSGDLTINLGGEYYISGISYTSPAKEEYTYGSASQVVDYEVLLSDDGINYTSSLTGKFKNQTDTTVLKASLPIVTKATHLKFRILSGNCVSNLSVFIDARSKKYTKLWNALDQARATIQDSDMDTSLVKAANDNAKALLLNADITQSDIGNATDKLNTANRQINFKVTSVENIVGNEMSLDGLWKLKLGYYQLGDKLYDTVKLPGSLDESGKGYINKSFDKPIADDMLMRNVEYAGPAVYQRIIKIPAEWENKSIELLLERTKPSTVWIDDVLVGSLDVLSASHKYILPPLKKGEHTITIMVDNGTKRLMSVELQNSHMITENTQTNWNGIIGKMSLIARDNINFNNVTITPDVQNNTINIKGNLNNFSKENINAMIVATVGTLPSASVTTSTNTFEMNYFMGDNVLLWDEFNPNLYTLQLQLSNNNYTDTYTTKFGMREFKTVGTAFYNNGKKVFLRGEVNCMYYPITGYVNMDKEYWLNLFANAKSYGFNHFRFHSSTPPKSAFDAADEVGIYIQTELPLWPLGYAAGFRNQDFLDYYKREAKSILENYSNNPSLVMLTIGNEIGWKEELYDFNKEFSDFIKSNSRILLCQGTHSEQYKSPKLFALDDYFIFATRGKGFLDNTLTDYSSELSKNIIPWIAHETGQCLTFPAVSEIEKYTGVLNPTALIKIKKQLTENGLISHAEDFARASAAQAADNYKDEIESQIRTKNYAGFQMLGWMDFTGQGTAMVGIVDSFGAPKKGSMINTEFSKFNNAGTVLARFKSYIWGNNQTFTADIEFANYTNTDITNQPKWRLSTKSGVTVNEGTLPSVNVLQGELKSLGKISSPLSSLTKNEELILSISMGAFENSYHLWVYPQIEQIDITPKDNVLLVRTYNQETEQALLDGKTVVLIPDKATLSSMDIVRIGYNPPFWSSWSFNGTTNNFSIFINPNDKIFNSFATNYYSTRNWKNILNSSYALNLKSLPKDFEPTVFIIDNFRRNEKLSPLFETKVGKGKLIISTIDFIEKQNTVEARQLFSSILTYASSSDFEPTQSITIEDLGKIINKQTIEKIVFKDAVLPLITATSIDPLYPITNIMDGDINTFWHNDYTHPAVGKLPQSLAFDFGETKLIEQIFYTPRQDSAGGYPYRYEFWASETLAEASFIKIYQASSVSYNSDRVVINLPKPVNARYVKMVILSKSTAGSESNTAASVAEISFASYYQNRTVKANTINDLSIIGISNLVSEVLISDDNISSNSSNSDVAYVKDGKLVAVNKGKTRITITINLYASTKTAYFDVIVVK